MDDIIISKEMSAKIDKSKIGTKGTAQFITEDHPLAPSNAKEIGDKDRAKYGVDDGSNMYFVDSTLPYDKSKSHKKLSFKPTNKIIDI